MSKIKKLPQNEFEIMKEIWCCEEPITNTELMKKIGNKKNWKIQTLISHLKRLVEKGFLSTYKEGNERRYNVLISKENYLKQETANFISLYHDNSLVNFFGYLFDKNKKLTDEEVKALIHILEKEKGGGK